MLFALGLRPGSNETNPPRKGAASCPNRGIKGPKRTQPRTTRYHIFSYRLESKDNDVTRLPPPLLLRAIVTMHAKTAFFVIALAVLGLASPQLAEKRSEWMWFCTRRDS